MTHLCAWSWQQGNICMSTMHISRKTVLGTTKTAAWFKQYLLDLQDQPNTCTIKV